MVYFKTILGSSSGKCRWCSRNTSSHSCWSMTTCLRMMRYRCIGTTCLNKRFHGWPKLLRQGAHMFQFTCGAMTLSSTNEMKSWCRWFVDLGWIPGKIPKTQSTRYFVTDMSLGGNLECPWCFGTNCLVLFWVQEFMDYRSYKNSTWQKQCWL